MIEKIIVQSLGRAGNCPSTKWLTQSTKRHVTFAVHEDEADAYQKAYPWAKVMVVPEDVRHHDGKLRKFILSQNDQPYFAVDDDIRVSLKGVSTIDAMFDVLERHIECGLTMAGLGMQLFSNSVATYIINKDPFAVPRRFATTVYAIDPVVFHHSPIDKLQLYADIAQSIHAIQYGGGSLITMVGTHSNVSPPSGGCNSWRTREMILEDLKAICALYPTICSARPTDFTTHGQKIGVKLHVNWKAIKKEVS